MAVFKCKMCGGSLEKSDGMSVATCEYCGTKQTVPKSRDEVVSNLFNRANNLRLKCEFDKAEEVYEKILDIDNTDAEAHWGIVLCKYGIEYVEDPKTYSRIPTCHRTLYEAVLTDINYLAAIENADAEQKELYIAEAKIIDELQKNILSIVNSEEPFDIFLCYKETDENGKRTVDSAITNDIYYQLTQEGFKVFYAPITLEDKLGHEYEPYIFAALNSAKVMLVVGTKPEYFDSVWVRNEWSRFFKSMKNDRSKLLIPCYRDMDVYDMPDEFAHLQAQDMGKIGFITDIIRGLKKVFDRDVQQQPQQPIKRNEVINPLNTNKVKKPSKLKPIIEKWKQKRKERAKHYLRFPLHTISVIFFAICVILSIYFLCKKPDILTYMDCYLSSIVIMFGSIIPLLTLLRFIKNKIAAIVLQSIVLIVSIGLYLSDVSYDSFELFLMGLFAVIAQAIWLVLVCFTKKVEKSTVKKTNKILAFISAVLVSAFLILTFELGAFSFLDYQYAKLFYNGGDYGTAREYFVYLNGYKDSEAKEESAYKSYIKSLNCGKEVDGWTVTYKEGDKVLLVSTTMVSCKGKSILGGWGNSDLRRYLNTEFYSRINNKIKRLTIINNISKDSQGRVFEDKVFILSEEEYIKYGCKRLASHILRDNNNNTYKIVNEYSHVSYIEYVKDINKPTGPISFNDYLNIKNQEKNNEMIENANCYPAIWVDLSEIQ